MHTSIPSIEIVLRTYFVKFVFSLYENMQLMFIWNQTCYNCNWMIRGNRDNHLPVRQKRIKYPQIVIIVVSVFKWGILQNKKKHIM